MTCYDLCVAWNWEHDADFVALLDATCRSRGLSMLQITPDNLTQVWPAVEDGQITFQVYLDRASEVDARFAPFVQWARSYARYRINPHEQASLAWDKSRMHRHLIDVGLYTPHTIVLPPYAEQPHVPAIDLSPLGDRFTIKPAHGSGGVGVVMEATSLQQILAARQEHANDAYLLQAHVAPVQLGSRVAWFRVLFCAGRVYPCWWDTGTHVYTPVTSAEEYEFGLQPLRDILASVARVCGLEMFSTEIAFTAEGRFVIVDYANDQIDLRLQSKAADGVPDHIVLDMADRVVGLVQTHAPPYGTTFMAELAQTPDQGGSI